MVSGIGLEKTAEWTNFGAFYLAGMLLILAGTVDDYLDLTPTQKLACQALAALVMVRFLLPQLRMPSAFVRANVERKLFEMLDYFQTSNQIPLSNYSQGKDEVI